MRTLAVTACVASFRGVFDKPFRCVIHSNEVDSDGSCYEDHSG